MSAYTSTTVAPDFKPRVPSPSEAHVVDPNEGHGELSCTELIGLGVLKSVPSIYNSYG